MVVQSMERSVQRDLVEAAQRGDHEAFEVLAKGSADHLFAIARLILRDVDLAQDAVQEALIRSWRGLPSLRDPERFDAWLHRLLVNCCTDQARSRQRLAANVRVIDDELPGPDGSGLVADRDQLERGFRRLRIEQRTLVVLRYYVGLSLPELAATLSLPLGTVKSRLHYAMETLRAALEADLRPGTAATEKTA
jgi:RNA polymerase sigma-70 factor (ECF subfamily)